MAKKNFKNKLMNISNEDKEFLNELKAKSIDFWTIEERKRCSDIYKKSDNDKNNPVAKDESKDIKEWAPVFSREDLFNRYNDTMHLIELNQISRGSIILCVHTLIDCYHDKKTENLRNHFVIDRNKFFEISLRCSQLLLSQLNEFGYLLRGVSIQILSEYKLKLNEIIEDCKFNLAFIPKEDAKQSGPPKVKITLKSDFEDQVIAILKHYIEDEEHHQYLYDLIENQTIPSPIILNLDAGQFITLIKLLNNKHILTISKPSSKNLAKWINQNFRYVDNKGKDQEIKISLINKFTERNKQIAEGKHLIEVKLISGKLTIRHLERQIRKYEK